ncbi:MAG: phosphatase PAP2 family protein, partial [Chromatiales bacterium]|nr:phosphatase PAP2 family protein [Chromatiales bacterium]
ILAFNVFHGHLAHSGRAWHLFWAATNTRLFDGVSASVFGFIFFTYIWAGGWDAVPKRVAQGVFLAGFTVIVLYISTKQIFVFERFSPSLVLEPVVRLSTLITEVKVKDASGNAFPGDHGTAVMLFTCFIWAFAGRRRGLAALGVACFVVLPRMVSGAHWITDLLVGSASIALVSVSLALATPFGWRVIQVLEVLLAAVLRPIRGPT